MLDTGTLFFIVLHSNWHHQTLTIIGPVTRHFQINMKRMQAKRTVITATSSCVRLHNPFAITTLETLIGRDHVLFYVHTTWVKNFQFSMTNFQINSKQYLELGRCLARFGALLTPAGEGWGDFIIGKMDLEFGIKSLESVRRTAPAIEFSLQMLEHSCRVVQHFCGAIWLI